MPSTSENIGFFGELTSIPGVLNCESRPCILTLAHHIQVFNQPEKTLNMLSDV